MCPTRHSKYLPRLSAILRIACRPMDGIVHLSFPHLVLSCGPKAHVSVQVDRKDGGRPYSCAVQYDQEGVTRRSKHACRSCEAGIAQATAKPRLIEGGMPTEATIAAVILSKYADHLPLYRQSQIYSRQGMDIDQSTLAFWVGKAAHELRPVHDVLLAHLRGSSKLFMPSQQHALHAPAG
jgi:transposase